MRLFGLLVLAGVLVGLPTRAEVREVNRIAAIVNDAVITWREVAATAAQSVEGLRRIYADQPEKFREEANKVGEESLEMLVERQLVLNDYKTSGLQIPEAIIEDEIRNRIRERYGDRAKLTKELQSRGLTYESYRQSVRDEIITYIMRQRNVSSAIIISPAKIEKFYQDNLTNYNVGDQVKLRVIVLNVRSPEQSGSTRKVLQEIITKLDTGIPFSEMAAVCSEGSQRQEGGDWGWRDRAYLAKGLSDVAFALNAKQRSGIIGLYRERDDSYWTFYYDATGGMTTARKYSRDEKQVEEKKLKENLEAAKGLPEPQEYYLLMVEDKRNAHTKKLTEVQDQIEKDLVAKEVKRLHKKWIDRLRTKSFVRYY